MKFKNFVLLKKRMCYEKVRFEKNMLLNDQNLLEQKNVYRDLICLWGIHFQRLDELIVKRVED